MKRSIAWRASFGPFILSPAERLLERDGAAIRLGGRALDLLIALVESAGEIVGKKELMARVWPDVVVEEGSLRFHMVAVRKALGDGEGGCRYIVNIPNKGYTFVAAVQRGEQSAPARAIAARGPRSLPALATTIVGRDLEIDALVTSLLQRRLVSVVGSGGIGKTTLAIASAQAVASHFDGDVHFVDLSTISDAALVRSSVASTVGLQNRLDEPAALAVHLAERKALIFLDGCEHVVSGVAELVEVLVRQCPRVHLLATSREPLLAEAEFVYRLPALAFPAEGEGTTAESALAYPAVRLLVDRAAASGSGFELRDSDAPLASQLCRELEGIALALELAAGRIEALGLKAVTSHFDASARLTWHGRRTAVPRHQTLGATLDWSYTLLSEHEKRLMRRLSVFSGTFSFDAAFDVCCFDHEKILAIELIASLVSKSLVSVDAGGATLRYRMLDTTKAYCNTRLRELGEDASVSRRFADYFGRWAQDHEAHRLSKEALDVAALELPNLRAALEWHFRGEGQSSDAVRLAAGLCPLLLQLSKVAECARWAQAALSRMPLAMVGSQFEVRLQASLGQSLMYSTGGGGGEAAAAFGRGIEIAERLGNYQSVLNQLNGCVALQQREGRYTDSLATARKAQALSARLDDPQSRAIVDSLMGFALHLTGDVAGALQHWERFFSSASGLSSGTASPLAFDFHVRALCGLARTLWLTGQYAKAIDVADETIAQARDSGYAVPYCIALIWAGSVHAWARDVDRQLEMVETLARVAREHSLAPYQNVARIRRGQWLIVSGRPAEGVECIRSALEALHDCRYEMVTTQSLAIMARGLSGMSLHAAALEMCDKAERLIRSGGDYLRMPPLWTTRGMCLAAAGQADAAEKSYLTAIELARSQGVKSGQVWAAVALAQQWMAAGRAAEARRLLRPHVLDAGDETSSDLVLARSLLG
jgi:predicted ATPase/DNA-binding winged helix-turn-helix (wHTH) protein